jgi:hypothetical protein
MLTPEIGIIFWQIFIFILTVAGAYFIIKLFRLLFKYLQNRV